MVVDFAAVALGGALGATMRYGAGLLAAPFALSESPVSWFPLATFAVNLIGSFAIGFLSHFFEQASFDGKATWKLFAVTGVLGGFTTMSSFSLESTSLLADGRLLEGGFYAVATMACCLALAACGRALARAVFQG